jgi:hypothetical protein
VRTSSDYRQFAEEQRKLVLTVKCLVASAEHRRRADSYDALAATEDWLNGAVSPIEEKPMPVYPVDMHERVERIAKQRAERERKVVTFVPRARKLPSRSATRTTTSVFTSNTRRK